MTVVDQLAFSKNALNQYVKKIEKLIESEVANEESFYADFRDLLKAFFKTEEFEVIIVPKAEEKKDKPDFIVYMDNIPIIHVEGKKPYDPVDKWLLADTTNRLFNQVYRFRGREDNNIPVMVTDFINIWVIDKEIPNSKDSDHQVKLKLKLVNDSETSWKAYSGIKPKLESALNYLCKDIVLSISKVSSMIPHLVKYAKKLKEEIIEVFKDPSNPMKNYLENIRNDFLDSIFSSDKEKKSQEFADLFAQTLVYGGFIAWMRFCKDGNSSNDFSFGRATDYLPYGTFIYNIFADMLTKSSPNIRRNIFEKIERIFQSTQFEKITKNTETLMITFYSDFLQKYDPEIAKDRGIVYTPHPIVNFIIRGIDYFIIQNFNEPEGIISQNVTYLDPAAGTMAFPCEILRFAKNFFEDKFTKQPGRFLTNFQEWVKQCYLKNSYAFEILMAPYLLGHLRTNMLLDEFGVKINGEKERIKLYLFNTLMELQTTIKDFRNPSIGEEIISALNIRNNQNILTVFSNPPYNVSSQNDFDWINQKINYKKKYFTREEKRRISNSENNEEEIREIRMERNDYMWDLQRENTKKITGLTSLHDDYVKFIRFAQWKIKTNGFGIVGYITNNYYIDGLQFRGMRSSLIRDFDQIWIVDLHGDARKGIPLSIQKKGIKNDKNVFNIKVGVAIIFLIRTKVHSDIDCKVKYIDIWGDREKKFEFLGNRIANLDFKEVDLRLDYEFCPDEFEEREKYLKFTYLLDIFKNHISGIKTGHDHEIMDYSKEETEEKIEKLFKKYEDPPDIPTISWNPKKILDTNIKSSKNVIIEWNWRGFDKRYLSFNPKLIARPRFSLLQYMLPEQNNICLIINRQSRGCKGDSSVLITNTIFDNVCNEGSSGLHSYAFPLKVYDPRLAIDEQGNDKVEYKPKRAIHSNIKIEFKSKLQYGDDIEDQLIFYYIYGLLFSPTYRTRYYLGLRKDYPRIPFPKDLHTFTEMAILGKKIAEIHLLRSHDLDPNQFLMSQSRDFKIHYVRSKDKDENGNQIPDTYDPLTKKIYLKKRTKSQVINEKKGEKLNEITWIGGITQEMWDFEIGGRQQLKEWLYARRYSEEAKSNTISRPLKDNELEYFLKMCDAIKKTIALLPKLDQTYKKIDP